MIKIVKTDVCKSKKVLTMRELIIMILITGVFVTGKIYPSEMWYYKARQDYEHYNQSEYFNGDKVIKMIRNGEYGIFQFENNQLTKISNEQIDVKIGAFSDIFSNNKRLIVSSGNNSLFEFYNGKWNTFQYMDRFNHKDSLEMRRINKIVELKNKIYTLSYAYKLQSIDTTQSGVIEYRIDTTFNELFVYDETNLDLIYRSDASYEEKIYDITSDGENIWSIGDRLNRFENNELKESFDIITLSDLEKNTKLYRIASNGRFIYLLKGYDPFAPTDNEPLLIQFNKDSKEVLTFEFPLYESYGPNNENIFPIKMNNMEFINGEGIISTDKGIYKFDGTKIEYIDVFSHFLSEIPEAFLSYLSTSDISIDNNQIMISTNVGLIYTDTYTDVEVTNDNSKTIINLYPNVFSSSNQTINLESNIDINVESIVIYETSGRKIQEIKNVNNLTKGINETIQVDLNSGMYFLAIMSDEENFIYPIIIIK